MHQNKTSKNQKRISFSLSEDLHKKFKSKVCKKGRQMKTVLVQFVSAYVNED